MDRRSGALPAVSVAFNSAPVNWPSTVPADIRGCPYPGGHRVHRQSDRGEATDARDEENAHSGSPVLQVGAGDGRRPRPSGSETAIVRHVVGPGHGRSAAEERAPNGSGVAPIAGECRMRRWTRLRRRSRDRVSQIGRTTRSTWATDQTPGFIDNRATTHLFGIPVDLADKRCLDIGTYSTASGRSSSSGGARRR